jgi:REP element-mobilizing transposase RayT
MESGIEWCKRMQDFLDSGYGSCLLRDNRLAEIIENALLHFDGQRYHLHAWCVMPNHVHTLFTPREVDMSKIVHSWKSFTAHECNKAWGAQANFGRGSPLTVIFGANVTFAMRGLTSRTIPSRQAFVRKQTNGGGVAQEDALGRPLPAY